MALPFIGHLAGKSTKGFIREASSLPRKGTRTMHLSKGSVEKREILKDIPEPSKGRYGFLSVTARIL
jgi:hypothetical protein|tara:strand:- start:22570 stop:22770 length:201 start_codon:yes stop_codon:yes gene_type:complete